MNKNMNKLPLAVFVLLLALFLVPLLKQKDPSVIPSALVGKPAPALKLPAALEGRPGFTAADLTRETVLVNFFASWCLECRGEQKAFEDIGLPVYGIAYKDTSAKLGPWLKELGDPYQGIVADADGRAAIDWGVYGVPETFIVDKGVIRAKIIGAATLDKLVAEMQK